MYKHLLEDVKKYSSPNKEQLLEVLQGLITDEYEAIDGYNKSLDSFASFDKVVEVLTHIRDEEIEHVKELSELVDLITNDKE